MYSKIILITLTHPFQRLNITARKNVNIQLLWLKACLARKFFSLIASLSSFLQLKMWFMNKHRHHLGACQKCRISGPTPHLWNQRPHLTRSPGNLYEHKSLKSPDPIDLTNSNSTGNEDTSVLIVT